MVWGREAVVKGDCGKGSVTKHLNRSVALKRICMGCEVRIIMGVEVLRRAWGVIGS